MNTDWYLWISPGVVTLYYIWVGKTYVSRQVSRQFFCNLTSWCGATT